MNGIIKLSLLLAILLCIAYGSRAQTNNTSEGRTIVIEGLYIRVDTTTHLSYIYNHRKGKWSRKVYISINGGKESLLPKGGVMTVWNTSFQLTVTRKKYRKTYSI